MRRSKNDGSRVQGSFGYFDLGDWWLDTFTPEERRYIEEKHKPVGGSGGNSLTQGTIGRTSQTAAGLLVGLSSWFMDLVIETWRFGFWRRPTASPRVSLTVT